ncbi:MAG: putative motility protein [Corticimicrobacter sp.]|uniref:Putative motility protein n=1 Tax=Corticimicrobacter populi TaxID=2175229 RepID=A0A2V1K3Y2_9BURK|nr:putative motility protein [Corticimicrobacter populi]PWF25290.1 putative motility protein [Corticimicrobacter populi]QDQ87227.1 putative motility protein [Alcaligenaceae bacterium SJ-26]
MSMSIDSTVNAAQTLNAASTQQEVQTLMLRKTLDLQTQIVTDIMKSMPSLATEGSLGRNVNTYV